MPLKTQNCSNKEAVRHQMMRRGCNNVKVREEGDTWEEGRKEELLIPLKKRGK